MRTPRYGLIVIGASAGGFNPLREIFRALPADFPIPVCAVLHRPADGTPSMAATLGHGCAVPVQDAEDKEPLVGGRVYLAPAGYHLLVEWGGFASLSVDPPVLYSRPSIDVLFESAADAYGKRALGMVLAGSNADGAAGLRRIVEAGGGSAVQDPADAEQPLMPSEAIRLASPEWVLRTAALPSFLTGLV